MEEFLCPTEVNERQALFEVPAHVDREAVSSLANQFQLVWD